MVVSLNERLAEQFRVTGLADLLGAENMYSSTERLGAALEQAYRDALAWVAARNDDGAHLTTHAGTRVRLLTDADDGFETQPPSQLSSSTSSGLTVKV